VTVLFALLALIENNSDSA